MITLEPSNKFEEVLKDYLDQNASEALTTKINKGAKTLTQCAGYIKSEAKRQAQSGCAVIEDKVVFGWCIHFFEEDDIKPSVAAGTTAKVITNVSTKVITPKEEKPIKTEKPKKKEQKNEPEEQLPGQMSIFDLMGE